MKPIQEEMKKILNRIKEAQTQLQDMIRSHDWIEEAKEYAERQAEEIKNVLSGDVKKVKAFLEKEKKELARIQKQIPSEVKKFTQFANKQKTEFEKLLKNVREVKAPTVLKSTKVKAEKQIRKTKKKST